MGYAIHWGKTQCPENLDNTWEWWNWEADEWTTDPEAKFVCSSPPPIQPTTLPPTKPPQTTYPPFPDTCLSGSNCDGCSLTAGLNGITFCCSNDCNSGWINVDPSTDPLCQCGH